MVDLWSILFLGLDWIGIHEIDWRWDTRKRMRKSIQLCYKQLSKGQCARLVAIAQTMLMLDDYDFTKTN